MATASQNAELILAAILPNRDDLMDQAARQLDVAHFTDSTTAAIWQRMVKYHDLTGGVMPKYVLVDWANDQGEAGKAALFEETYDDLSSKHYSDAEFTWAVAELRRIVAEEATKAALAEGLEVLSRGVEDPRSGELIKGDEDARRVVIEAFADIDHDLGLEESPEGDMRVEASEFAAQYGEAVKLRMSGASPGINFGLGELDSKLGGLKRGDLVLSAGFSSDGKSALCVQLAWSAAVEQGKNFVFFTTETTRDVIRRRIVARHSTMPAFQSLAPQGLDTKKLKLGTLSDSEKECLKQVLHDLASNKNYGKMYIAQLPRGANMSSMEAKLVRLQRDFDIDLVICDYLALLRPSRARGSEREELNGIVREAKMLATTFDGGRGVPVVSPWQVNREWRDRAETLGFYTMNALADTSESSKSADIITAILAPTDNSNRHAELRTQILKNRDGETANGLLLNVDYATCTFSTKAGLTSFSPASFDVFSTGDGLDSFLS